jgi:hypothetical protein
MGKEVAGMNGLCCRRVRRFKHVGFYQCHNPGRVERAGKLYCSRHDPEARPCQIGAQSEAQDRGVDKSHGRNVNAAD